MEKTMLIPWISKEGESVSPAIQEVKWNKDFYKKVIEQSPKVIDMLGTSWLISEYPHEVRTIDMIVVSSSDPKKAITKVKQISYEGIYVVPDLFNRWQKLEKYLKDDNLFAANIYCVGKDTEDNKTFKYINTYLMYYDEQGVRHYV